MSFWGRLAANALSAPPGEYGRKPETQRNWRGPAQPVERLVQFDANRRTLPGLDMLGRLRESGVVEVPRTFPQHRWCMAVVSSCREMLG